MWRAMKNARDAGIVAALRQRSIGAVVAPILEFSGLASGDGIFDGSEAAEAEMLSVMSDLGYPLGALLVPTHPGVS